MFVAWLAAVALKWWGGDQGSPSQTLLQGTPTPEGVSMAWVLAQQRRVQKATKLYPRPGLQSCQSTPKRSGTPKIISILSY